MSQRRVPDDPWEAIAPLLPRERTKRKGGRPRITDRAALGGSILALRLTGAVDVEDIRLAREALTARSSA